MVALLAVAAARFVNWAIYNWAWNRRILGPWSALNGSPPIGKKSTGKRATGKKATAKKYRLWSDHLPVLGWFALRREASEHGKGYWVRPLLVELLFPVCVTWYYCQYVSGGMLPARLVAWPLPEELESQLHWQFLAHAILFSLMAIATFIDFDEQSIPDLVTVPGTVIGILGAAIAPAWLPFHPTAFGVEELHANIPGGWPLWLDGQSGLWFAVLILLVWAFALLDRRWITRRGYGKAMQYFMARMFRVRVLWLSIAIVTTGLLLVVVYAWFHWNGPTGRWKYLLSSLFGLAFAGGFTWGVRLSASAGLGVEALGFGDVTLMAMIGTYVGWQPSLLVFFIAPMVAIVFVILRAILTGETATPYGPYLCGAAVLTLVFWDAIWSNWAGPVFALGTQILYIVVGCIVLMGAMLWIWRLIKQALGLAGR